MIRESEDLPKSWETYPCGGRVCLLRLRIKTGNPQSDYNRIGDFFIRFEDYYIFISTTTLKKKLIQQAISLIHQRSNEELTLEKVAKECGFSKYYFSRIFKKYTGKTFKSYLIDLRINKAKDLLLNSELAISQICYEAGFNDLSYFNRVFKKKVGCSPSEFRENKKE